MCVFIWKKRLFFVVGAVVGEGGPISAIAEASRGRRPKDCTQRLRVAERAI